MHEALGGLGERLGPWGGGGVGRLITAVMASLAPKPWRCKETLKDGEQESLVPWRKERHEEKEIRRGRMRIRRAIGS